MKSGILLRDGNNYMDETFVVLNIKEYLRYDKGGEELLMRIYSTFCCTKNRDVHKFLIEQSIDFTKKNQSVTYLVFTKIEKKMVGYFTITIKPISVHGEGLSNTVKRKIARVSKLDKENEQYMLSAYLIAQLGKNFRYENDIRITGKQLLNLAIDKIREIQYMAGGKVMFLEAENKEKLLNFYERENGFKQFNTRPVMSKEEKGHTLVQLLQVL